MKGVSMVLVLTDNQVAALREGADACETLADIDEGENMNVDRLLGIAIVLRRMADASLRVGEVTL
jgi:hypothetical protein